MIELKVLFMIEYICGSKVLADYDDLVDKETYAVVPDTAPYIAVYKYSIITISVGSTYSKIIYWIGSTSKLISAVVETIGKLQ
jgi:hypothetical protein